MDKWTLALPINNVTSLYTLKEENKTWIVQSFICHILGILNDTIFNLVAIQAVEVNFLPTTAKCWGAAELNLIKDLEHKI